jgi:hypothetical protein
VAGRSDWQSPLFTALAPLAFLRPGTRRIAGLLAAYVLYLFATWWLLTHRLDRFWLPLLPPLAVLAGLGADWTRNRIWLGFLALMMSLAILTSLVMVTTALTGLNQWTDDLNRLRDEVPRMTNSALARLDRELPADAKVLLVGQAGVFHVRHPVAYNVVFSPETIETLAKGRTPAEVQRALIERGITHVYVDWGEVERHTKPGGYGFTPFVTPGLFSRLVEAGVLDPQPKPGDKQKLYRVRK